MTLRNNPTDGPLRLLFAVLIVFLVIATALGCAASETPASDEATPAAEEPAADTVAADEALTLTAELQSAADQNVSGTVVLTLQPDGSTVAITAEISGLSPGLHGFHIHETGDCSAADFTSAGGHFAPMGHPHAAPDAPEHHAGDLGNIEANDEGVAVVDTSSSAISLEEGAPSSVVGRAVIVHADADDLTSQPSGAAGGRIACGVLR